MKYKFKKGDRAIFFHHILLGERETDRFLASYSGRAVRIIQRRKDLYYCRFINDRKTGIVPICERDLKASRHPLTTFFEK